MVATTMAAQPLCEEPHGVNVRVKICGLTRVDEAVACVRAGADLIGLNFHAGSTRFVDPSQARQIITAIARPAQAVGLFVNRPAAEVVAVADLLGLHSIQLHGDEPPEDLPLLDRFWIIRAFRLGCVADIRAMTGYLERARQAGRSPDAVLVDAHVPGRVGGTATLVPEDVLAHIPLPSPPDPCGWSDTRKCCPTGRADPALDGGCGQRRRVVSRPQRRRQGRRVHSRGTHRPRGVTPLSWEQTDRAGPSPDPALRWVVDLPVQATRKKYRKVRETRKPPSHQNHQVSRHFYVATNWAGGTYNPQSEKIAMLCQARKLGYCMQSSRNWLRSSRPIPPIA